LADAPKSIYVAKTVSVPDKGRGGSYSLLPASGSKISLSKQQERDILPDAGIESLGKKRGNTLTILR